jgi:hypothetical protein
VNKIKPLIQLNPYFKLRPTYSCSSLNKSVDYNLYGLIKHFSQRKTLINNMKRFTHKLLLPIAISSLLVGNVTAEGSYQVNEGFYQVDEGSYQVDEGSYQVDEGFYQVDEGSYQVDEGFYQVDEGSYQVDEGFYQVDEGSYQVDEGSYQVDEGFYQVDEGSYQVDEGSYQVDEGFYQVNEGSSSEVVKDVSSDTGTDTRKGPYAVDLGSAGSFSILSKSGITDVYRSAIVGDVGTSPITGAALLLTCEEVKGNIFTVDAAGPYPCAESRASDLTLAVSHMEAAYVDAAGRSSPDFIELGAGEIGGLTLEPGLYKWSSGVTISTDVTFSGSADDVWILQIAGTMNEAVSTKVTLAGGALASNIFWQVAEATTIGSYAHFEGVILSKTMIAVNTGASVNGRLLAQTAVTLQMNNITEPSK